MIRADIKPMSAEDCVKEFDLVISEMQINLKPGQKINFEYTGNSEVTLDKHLLRNICMNLLSNATKFSPEGSMINVIADFKPASFNLSVQDYGIGISESDMQHLFERFFRAKNAFNIQGTGLGLVGMEERVRAVGGTVTAGPRPDGGWAVHMEIPT